MKKIVEFKKLDPDAILPDYAHEGDAGMDLYSIKDEIIEPLSWKLVPTGLACKLPFGTNGEVRSKSGIALKNGVFVLNTPGTVDENYRGEIGVILYNLNTKEPFVIKKGQKIAQFVINSIEYVDTIEVKELDETSRGEGGFGSSGLGRNKK